jgi:hypothetical protein
MNHPCPHHARFLLIKLHDLHLSIKPYGFALHFINLPNDDNKNILMKFAEELTKVNKNKNSELKL